MSYSAIPSKDTNTSHLADRLSAEPFRFEPTVFEAMRRYHILVLAVAVIIMLAAIGYSLIEPKTYRAQAYVTMPQQAPLQGQQPDAGQYLDSQVLLLQSGNVAQRAAAIANARLHSHSLTVDNFFGNGSSLKVTPPTTAAPGTYGATVIAVSFTGSSAQIAQVAANAVLQAYNEARSAIVRSQDGAVVEGIGRAIANVDRQLASVAKQLSAASSSASPDAQNLEPQLMAQRAALTSQRTALVNQQVQAIVSQQIDLAQQPAVQTAGQPVTQAKHKWAVNGIIGFIIGALIGSALAFARARRRRIIADREDPSVIYGVPLIGEIPAFDARKIRPSNGRAVSGLLPMAADPQSAVAETFRFAAEFVERIRVTRGPRLSLAFVSSRAGSGRSTVVANLGLAIAEGGTRVLVVDADTLSADLTARLLPRAQIAGGFEQVLAGERAFADCIRACSFNSAVTVLPSGPSPRRRVTGAARSAAVAALLAEAKATFDAVLIDGPPMLAVADATAVEAADGAIVVIGPNELVQDHREMAERLNLIGSDIVGYIYNRAPAQAGSSVTGATVQQRYHPASRLDWRGGLFSTAHHRASTAASSRPPPKG
jgi:Mrp family chromosome partitioning ATPase/LPS O-antigen subunit length determinant protein (WzzB/FepE family)